MMDNRDIPYFPAFAMKRVDFPVENCIVFLTQVRNCFDGVWYVCLYRHVIYKHSGVYCEDREMSITATIRNLLQDAYRQQILGKYDERLYVKDVLQISEEERLLSNDLK